MVWKVVSRDKKGRQVKKKVYETDSKYTKHGHELVKRWREWLDVEVYSMDEDENFILQYVKYYPKTEEELRQMQKEYNYSDNWFTWKLKYLEV